MIQFNAVSKDYASGHHALNQASFSLAKGEMAFLTGASGAGKSTILKLIARLETPTSGEIIVNGARLHQLKKRQIAAHRAAIGMAFQSPHLLHDRTVFYNVALPLEIQGSAPSLIAKRVRTALDMVGLLKKENQHPAQLSGGEQQRVGLARAVVHKPALLIADEPTGNLDPALSTDIMGLFEQFNQSGVTVLIATHDLPLIASMRHRILLVKEGRVW